MDRNILLTLLKEENYPAHMLDKTIEKLEKLQPEILSAFTQWLSDGKTPSISIENFSFQDLTMKFGMTPVGAFITLDWLVREPEKAKRSLERGIR
jgi:hypothetical protein